MSETFQFSRFYLLVRSTVISNYRNWFTFTMTMVAVIFFAAIVSSDNSREFYVGWFSSIFMILGIVLSSRVFREMHDKTRNQAFLLIPASHLEKTLAQLFMVTLGLFVYLVVLMMAVSFVFELAGFILFNRDIEFFNPFVAQVWGVLAVYLYVHSFFFLGAAWFKKNHLVKTVLSMSIIGVGMGMLAAILMQIIFSPYLDYEIEYVGKTVLMQFFENNQNLIVASIMLLAAFITIANWYIAWQRVSEVQVSDGV